jgi:hypothetical protein
VFQNSVTYDVGVFNGTTAVSGEYVIACGTGGVFVGQQDPHVSNGGVHPYFCNGTNGSGPNLNSPYSKDATHFDIISTSYSGIFSTTDDIFAESLPVILGFRDDGTGTTINDEDHFMDNSVAPGLFSCSENVLTSMFFDGTLPTTTPPGESCPYSN